MINKPLNPDAFREFKFRKWIHSRLGTTGIWMDDYQKMNWRQKLAFHLFGSVVENFRPKFKLYLDLEEVKG